MWIIYFEKINDLLFVFFLLKNRKKKTLVCEPPSGLFTLGMFGCVVVIVF